MIIHVIFTGNYNNTDNNKNINLHHNFNFFLRKS